MSKTKKINAPSTPTLNDEFAKELVRMSSDISASDKQNFIKKFEYSEATISRYLRGRGRDVKIAHRMYVFFAKCIDQRAKALA